MSEQENILKLKEMIEVSDNIVFFGGAGVSTESGIPDFRSETGIYNTVHKYGCSPEQILSHTFFMISISQPWYTQMQNRMRHTKHWRNWKNLAN